MPPQIALFLSLGFSSVLVWRELKQHPEVSKAVWIPCFWLLILGSRSVSQWLNLSPPVDVDVLMDGSPADRMVFTLLMVSALVVLRSRRVAWTKVVAAHPWLILFFVYCVLSVVWSDFPGVALKRWFKSLGDPLMVLVLLSETNPAAAITSVLKRCAFILVPLSIVFIKYFPELGRAHDQWSGAQFYTGVTTNKNTLGYLLLVCGLYFICVLMTRRSDTDVALKMRRRADTVIAATFLLMVVYLFQMADSVTPLLALFVASGVVAGLALQGVSRHFGLLASATLVLAAVFQLLFGAADFVIEIAGREATTFTGRTDIWGPVLAMTTNPLLGAGFQSFWLGDRLYKMWALFPVFRPNQAHNGYIEIYINLGLVGLVIVSGVIVSTYRAARHRLATVTDASGAQFDEVVFAKFGMSYLMAFLLYNVTEATLQPLNVLFVVLLLVSFRVAPRSTVAREVRITKIEPMGAGVVRGSLAARGPNRWGDRDRGSNWSPTASRRGGTPTRRDQFRVRQRQQS
jgi:exopolysaccharide production protein ExoQ